MPVIHCIIIIIIIINDSNKYHGTLTLKCAPSCRGCHRKRKREREREREKLNKKFKCIAIPTKLILQE